MSKGIRPIVRYATQIGDATISRAIAQLEDRMVEAIGHEHAPAPPTAPILSTIIKTADTVFASATAADVPKGASGAPMMAFPVRIGRVYHFRWVSIARSDTATVGPAMSVTHPGATVFAAAAKFVGNAADGVDAEWQGNITTSDDPVAAGNVAVINTDYVFTVEGILIPSATGAFTLRARTETGVTNVTIRRGSAGLLWDLGILI